MKNEKSQYFWQKIDNVGCFTHLFWTNSWKFYQRPKIFYKSANFAICDKFHVWLGSSCGLCFSFSVFLSPDPFLLRLLSVLNTILSILPSDLWSVILSVQLWIHIFLTDYDLYVFEAALSLDTMMAAQNRRLLCHRLKPNHWYLVVTFEQVSLDVNNLTGWFSWC